MVRAHEVQNANKETRLTHLARNEHLSENTRDPQETARNRTGAAMCAIEGRYASTSALRLRSPQTREGDEDTTAIALRRASPGEAHTERIQGLPSPLAHAGSGASGGVCGQAGCARSQRLAQSYCNARKPSAYYCSPSPPSPPPLPPHG